ncbi:MAG: YhbY family RNA-binding protein [Deltaproteobacteria bacterium]|nr:MAG: YhbY family RNA-binding protein [Deltaproteobacteria bacterium]
MSRIAKTVTRYLDLAPNATLGLSLSDEGLASAVRSLAGSVGAVEPAEGEVQCGLVDLETAPAPLVPLRVQQLIERVTPGGLVVVVIHSPNTDQHINELAAQIGPSLDLTNVAAERDGLVAILRGHRRTALTRTRIKELRGVAHGVEASILVGRLGLTTEIVAATRAALERHGLVKAKMTPQCELDKEEVARDLAWATGAKLIQRIGKTAILFRPDVKLDPPVTHRRGGNR